MAWDWLIELIIILVIDIIVYLIMPKPDSPPSIAAADLNTPTAEAGRPIAFPFGTVTIKSLNTLAVLEKGRREYSIEVGGGKK